MRFTKGKGVAKRAVAFVCAITVQLLSLTVITGGNTLSAKAAQNSDTTKIAVVDDRVDLRFVLTTDLHGMVSSTDYLAGTSFTNRGLARAYNLIQMTRAEKQESNVFTFDAGDVLFDASMEYILEQDEDVIQPIYQAMSYIGYDAITLGNHDFDYGKSYLLEQLQLSGLTDKVVVSNLQNSKDGTYPFHENMIIEREAVTQQGKTVTVKIGIVGETIPTLSAKTDNYTGVWKTEDIVANTKKQSEKLKEQGADIVIALVHSGFGEEEPEENATNAAYALTKLGTVDVVLCGHEHNNFPSSDSPSSYKNMPGVDMTTGLVNGKVVVMAASQAAAIGVVDMSLSYDEQGNYTIEEKQGSVRKVSDYKLDENPLITSTFDDWKEEMEAYRSKDLITLGENVVLENYFGLLQDNASLQLQNDAKIAYARQYIEVSDKTYAGYPVIAASSFYSYGANGDDNYVDISGKMTYSDLFELQSYRHYTCLYTITGKQLKEWLELSASAYTNLSKATGSNPSLIAEDWIDNWSKFTVFDGINYTISPYVEPRYDINGNKINETRRVSNITYDGKAVTDDQVFIIASNSLSSAGSMFSWNKTQQVKGLYRTQVLIADYLKGKAMAGDYTPVADNNWTLALNVSQGFSLRSTEAAKKYTGNYSSYKGIMSTTEDGVWYKFTAGSKSTVTEPYIIAQPSVVGPTANTYDILVEAFSSSGITKLSYVNGKVSVRDYYKYNVRDIKNNRFTVYNNGTYTVYAEDKNGNKVLYYLVIDNIGSKEIDPPTVWSFNNKKSAVTGKAEAGTTVMTEIAGKTYKAKVLSNGTFSLSVPALNAGSVFYVYVTDTTNKRTSSKVKVRVKRSGPNQPTVEVYNNTDAFLSGNTNDEDAFIYVVVDSIRTIFVPEGGAKDIFLASPDISYSNYNIEEIDQLILDDGSFAATLPNIDVGTTLKIFSMDHVGRVSRGVTTNVIENGPYAPVIYTANDGESAVYGNIKSLTSKNDLKITLKAGDLTYIGSADSNGNFKISIGRNLIAGETISVFASDSKNGKTRTGRVASIKVSSFSDIADSEMLTLSPMKYNSKSLTVYYDAGSTITVAIPYASGTVYTTKTIGEDYMCKITLKETLPGGSYVQVISRNSLGRMVDAAQTQVICKAPTTPVIPVKVTNTHKTLTVITAEDCAVIAEIKDRVYVSEKGTYNKDKKGYVHRITITKADSGTKIVVYAKNATTESKKVSTIVQKLGPNTPTLSMLTAGSEAIQGYVELFAKGLTEDATVKNTKTKIYAKIDNVVYNGTVEADGHFVIIVPPIKVGTEIKVYASNKDGFGPIFVIGSGK